MKLLYVQMAKVIYLFDTRLINPAGLAIRDLLAAIKDRYGFAKAPIHEHDRTEKGALAFEGGVFFYNDVSLSVTLTIFSDGLVAETTSDTDNTRAFLEDLRELVIASGYSLPEPSSIREGLVSSVVVETETPLTLLNPKLEVLVKIIEAKTKTLDGKFRDYELAEISIATEDSNKALAPASFKFERRIDQPFDLNRYFSQAPLGTKDHMDLLEVFETILKS
jgi:hypothetical protein